MEQQASKIQDFLKVMENLTEYEFLKTLRPRVVVLHGGKGEQSCWHNFFKVREELDLSLILLLALKERRKSEANYFGDDSSIFIEWASKGLYAP